MQARRGRARKLKAKPKEQRGKAGRDLAQFRGTGAQVIIQMPKTRRARRAPLRAAKVAQVPIMPPVGMAPRPDALAGQQTTTDRLQSQINALEQGQLMMRTARTRDVEQGNVLGGQDYDRRLADSERAERDLRGQLVGEQSRLRQGFQFGAPASQASRAATELLAPPSSRPGSAAPRTVPAANPTVLELKAMLSAANVYFPSNARKQDLLSLASQYGLLK